MITGKWKKLGLLDCFTWIYPSMMHGDVLREIRCPYHLNNMQSDVCLWCQWWLITAGSAITLCDTLCYLFNKHLHRNKLQYVFIILFPSGEMPLHYFVCFFPLLLNCSPCFCNMLSAPNRNRLTQVTQKAAKIIGFPTPNLSDLNSADTARRAHTITHDPSCPISPRFTLLPSSHCYRLIVPYLVQ